MKSLTGRSILVIDDDPGMLRSLTKVLRSEGASVTGTQWAGDGIEILTKRDKQIDLVITDLRMPIVNGVTVVYAIHQIFPALPVIVLTAFATADVRDACHEQGAAAFLEKPLNTAQLLAATEKALGGTRTFTVISKANAITEETTTITTNNAIVAIYKSHAEADATVKELQQSGFDLKKLSIVGRGYHTDEHVVGYYNAGDRMKLWGKLGAFWGGIWGMLFGSAFFFIPGIGPLVVAGPLVAWIVGALETAVGAGGLSAIGAGLYSVGIPKDSILRYETALKADKFVLIAHGSVQEMTHAREIIGRTSTEAVEQHQSATIEKKYEYTSCSSAHA